MKTSIHTIVIPLWTFIFLGKPFLYMTVFISNDQSTIVWMRVGMGKQSNKTSMILMERNHTIEINIECCIRIQEKERLITYLFPQSKQSTSIAKR